MAKDGSAIGHGMFRRELPSVLMGVGVPLALYAYHLTLFHAWRQFRDPVPLALAILLGLAWSRLYRCRNRWLERPGVIAFLAASMLPVTVKLAADFLLLNSFFDQAFWGAVVISPVAGGLAAESAMKLAARIRLAEARLRRMAAAATDGLWESDFSTLRVYWSESFRRNFGYEKIVPCDTFEWLREHIHPEDREEAVASFERAVADPAAETWSGTFRFLRGDGLPVWVLTKARFERDASGAPLFAFGGMMDISDRKSRERLLESLMRELEDRVRELSEAEARTRRLARAGADVLWALDFKTDVLDWDASASPGFRYEVVLMGTLERWLERLHPQDRPGLESAFDEAAKNPSAETWQGTYRLRRSDSSYVWVMDRCVFERDATGVALKAYGGLVDISERIRLEDELRLRVEQRTRDLAALTRSVTHDLKSPLSSILGYGDLLEASGAITDPKASEHLRLMLRGAERMLLMVEDILDQAKGGEPSVRTTPVDLGLLTRDLHDEFEPRVRRLGGVLILPEGPLPEVMSAYAPLYRILQNLIGNACKYRRDTVPLRVCVGFSLRGNWLEMSIADNGIGIKPESLPTLFDFGARFDSDKAEGHGIGLYNVQTIARRMGGDVSVASVPGEGSTFTVKVPGRPVLP